MTKPLISVLGAAGQEGTLGHQTGHSCREVEGRKGVESREEDNRQWTKAVEGGREVVGGVSSRLSLLMAGVWQRLGGALGLLQLTLPICLLYPPLSALPRVTDDSKPPLQLTYRRPNEIRSRIGESITAPGPLTQDLHVYLIYQQPDPSVYYEYMETVDPAGPHKDSSIGDISSNEIPKDPPHPRQAVPEPEVKADPLPAYRWSRDGHTACKHHLRNSWDLGEWSECSRRCGPGTQRRQVICRRVTHAHANGTEAVATVGAELWRRVRRPRDQGLLPAEDLQPVADPQRGDVEEDSECNLAMKPESLENCDMGACARSWFTSPWSRRCSAECGEGSQTRTTVCLMDHVTNLPLDSCDGAHPLEVTSCNLGPCEKRLEWYTGPWGQCSSECGNGTQTRSVACLLNSNGSLEVVAQLKCSHLPQPITSQPCFLEPYSSCRDQYHNCAVVVQARLCVYPYYRGACCVSCARAPKPYTHSFLKKHIRRDQSYFCDTLGGKHG
ncbi:hypothetical protein CRUP_013095 [Coryphaenoides rupestris]|nr:hypothetical protein CRUP_013095 [Coryphaenoides rupestris]